MKYWFKMSFTDLPEGGFVPDRCPRCDKEMDEHIDPDSKKTSLKLCLSCRIGYYRWGVD